MVTAVPLELLAPARDAATAIAAIDHGADAVYMGASSHGARASAVNSTEDIARVADYAHRFGARVYVTVNTLVYDHEIRAVERLVAELYRVGADALIVQDLGLLRMDLPPIELHASTQCDIRTPAKAAFLESVGFSQLVLPRELTLDEIAAVKAVTTVPLEAFVHGALCVSYSGDCQASLFATGRSANRGECAQLCRLAYDLTDGNGRKLAGGKHLLSLRDMNRLENLEAMIEAGISSFKIEGRLKDEAYVKNVVGAYRRRLDAVIASSAGRYCRASSGRVELTFEPDVSKSFNRGFTPYFLTSRPKGAMASMSTPKWVGERVGKVVSVSGRRITLDSGSEIGNGDGLGFFAADGRLEGFRVNRAEGRAVIAARTVAVKPGTKIFRNRDKAWDDRLAGTTATRVIDAIMALRVIPGGIALDVEADGCCASAALRMAFDRAKTPQDEARQRILAKLGDTPYVLTGLNDRAGGLFVPASVLASLRRDAVRALDVARQCRRRTGIRRPETPGARFPSESMSYHDNVANRLARQFYREHGVVAIQPAAEVAAVGDDEPVVMTTRYCLRRELGACLRSGNGSALPQELLLRAPGICLRLEFDCKACRMHIRKVRG